MKPRRVEKNEHKTERKRGSELQRSWQVPFKCFIASPSRRRASPGAGAETPPTSELRESAKESVSHHCRYNRLQFTHLWTRPLGRQCRQDVGHTAPTNEFVGWMQGTGEVR